MSTTAGYDSLLVHLHTPTRRRVQVVKPVERPIAWRNDAGDLVEPERLPEQDAEGRWTIWNVCIFARLTRHGEHYDATWLDRIVASHRESGFEPPLVYGSDHSRSRGFVTNLRRYGNRLYADLVGVDMPELGAVPDARSGFSLSVELLQPDAASIAAVAVLPHMIPYYRFPLVLVSAASMPDGWPAPVEYSARGVQ